MAPGYPRRDDVSRKRMVVWGMGCALAAPVLAQQEAAQLAEVVSVTRGAVTAEETPLPVSVIDARQIEERPGVAGIQELLAEVPGVQFARSGGLGGQIVMRGFNSNSSRSIITVDGDRYRGRSTLEFNMFDPNAIERIEVIRGPASSLYGADAMNGVVNVVTRRAKVDPDQEFQLVPRLRAIDWNSVSNAVGARTELVGGGKGFDVLVGLHGRTAEDYKTPLGKAENSDYQTWGGDFNIGFRPDSASRWELSGRYQNVTTGRAGGLGAAPGAPYLEVRESPIVERHLKLGYQGRDVGAWADSLDASIYVRDFETDIYQVSKTSATVTTKTHTQVYTPTVWGGHVIAMKGLGNHVLSYGADFFSENFAGRDVRTTKENAATGVVTSDTGFVRADRQSTQTNVGVFVSDEWQVNDRVALSGALRGDVIRVTIGDALSQESAAQRAAFGANPDSTDRALTGSLGTVFKLVPGWNLVGNLSRGFRAPSGIEKTTTTIAGTITTLAAPELKPEVSHTLELGSRWSGQGYAANVTAYRTQYTDLITTVAVSSSLRQRKNISDATIDGVEVDGHVTLAPRWRFSYSVTALRGTDNSTGTPLAGIAPLSGRLALRYEGSGWYGEGVFRGYRGKSRINPAEERQSVGYGMVDLYAGIGLERVLGSEWKHWKVVAGLENAFDQVGRNPTVAESLSYASGLIGNALVEPGRAVVLKLSSDY